MDKEDIDIITRLNADQNKVFEKILHAKEENDNLKFKAIHKNIESGFEAIAIQMKERNNKVGKINSRLDEISGETSWWRHFQRNPKKTVFILFIFAIGSVVMMGFDVNVEKLMEIFKNLKP